MFGITKLCFGILDRSCTFKIIQSQSDSICIHAQHETNQDCFPYFGLRSEKDSNPGLAFHIYFLRSCDRTLHADVSSISNHPLSRGWAVDPSGPMGICDINVQCPRQITPFEFLCFMLTMLGRENIAGGLLAWCLLEALKGFRELS